MTEEQIALARRAVACRGWRWMPGMFTEDGFRVCRVDTDGYKFGYRTEYNYAYAVIGDVLPDLEDPATLGCLLALVREAHGDPHASVWYDSEYWQNGNRWSWHAKEQSLVDYDTEAEALVAALEAAP